MKGDALLNQQVQGSQVNLTTTLFLWSQISPNMKLFVTSIPQINVAEISSIIWKNIGSNQM